MKLVHMSVPHFHGYHLRDGSTDHLVLIANETSIQESHRTVADKGAVLKLAILPLPGLSAEGIGRNAHLAVFP